jgi:hypothetical protein
VFGEREASRGFFGGEFFQAVGELGSVVGEGRESEGEEECGG